LKFETGKVDNLEVQLKEFRMILLINGAHLHLLTNHWPVLIPIMAVPIIAIGTVVGLRQTRNVGLSLLAIGALAAWPTYFTGQAARAVVQNYPLITVASIQRHQDLAFYAFLVIEIVGVMSLFLLWCDWRKKPVTRGSLIGLILLALVAIFLIAQTAHLGGLIRHEELNQGIF
jgi:uncharacterized membrane protein